MQDATTYDNCVSRLTCLLELCELDRALSADLLWGAVHDLPSAGCACLLISPAIPGNAMITAKWYHEQCFGLVAGSISKSVVSGRLLKH